MKRRMTLFQLATKPRHAFGAQERIPPEPSAGEPERFTWTCQNCGLKRITVIPKKGLAYRAYAYADGIEFEDEREPECRAVKGKERAA